MNPKAAEVVALAAEIVKALANKDKSTVAKAIECAKVSLGIGEYDWRSQ